jgi:hypothetical protein
MTVDQFSSLPDPHSKLLLYLTFIVLGKDDFNLNRLSKILNKTVEEIMQMIRFLWELDIIDINTGIEDNDLYVTYFNHYIPLKIYCWHKKPLNLLNKIVFNNDPDYLKLIVNKIYRPLGVYNEETMGQWFDEKIEMRTVEIPDKDIEKDEAAKKRKEIRAVKAQKAKDILEMFYFELGKELNIRLDPDFQESELDEIKAFMTIYPEFPIDFLKGAVIWFLNNQFWRSIIVSFKTFRKHFPKYLAEEKQIKKTKNRIKLI